MYQRRQYLVELGWELGSMINPVIYSKDDWEKRHFTPFYINVKQYGLYYGTKFVLWFFKSK